MEFGNLAFQVAAEITHVDELGQLGVDGLKVEQRLADANEICAGACLGQLQRGIAAKRFMDRSTAASFREPLARRVDDDVAHRLCRVGEEVATVDEPQLCRVDETDEALVQQRGRPHAMVAAVSTQAGPGDALEVRIQGRVDLVKDGPIAAGRALQQRCDRWKFSGGARDRRVGRRSLCHAREPSSEIRTRPRQRLQGSPRNHLVATPHTP